MPEYTYTGIDRKGKKINGKLDAPSEGELRMILRGQGVRPTRIIKVGLLQQDLFTMIRGGVMGPVPIRVLANFTRQLHVLVGSGIPLVQALEVLGDQTPDPNLKKIILSVKEYVSQGAFFWEGLNKYKTSFPRLYIALIRAGEASGALETVLDRLSVYLEASDRLSKTVKSAMMYPVIVGAIGVGVIAALLIFVVPKMKGMIESVGGELPGPTQFVISLSEGIQNNAVTIIGGGLLFFFLAKRYGQSDEGRALYHQVFFRLPVFGELMQKAAVARFTRTMGVLLHSGINLVDAIDICRATIDNAVLENAVARVRRDVEEGKTLSGTLSRIKVFPKMAVHMVAVGENTGNLEKMLDRTAEIYDSDVETMVSGLSKLVEPIMLVVLGGIVAGVMVAMYLPIFRMAGAGA